MPNKSIKQMKNKSFEILHFSYRKYDSIIREQGCYCINLVFRASDTDDEYCNSKERFLYEAQEWQKSEIVQNPELAEEYAMGLEVLDKRTGRPILENYEKKEEDFDEKDLIPIDIVNTNGIQRENVYISGYKKNEYMMLRYIEKFDVFRFYEFFEINPATQGIIQYIENLKGMYSNDTYYADQLLRCIKSLEPWWD